MKVLVTGAAGFIGGQLWHTLWKRGDEVVGIDNFSYGSMDNLKFDDHDFGGEVRKMDIRDKAGMLALFEAEKFDVVYNIAGRRVAPFTLPSSVACGGSFPPMGKPFYFSSPASIRVSASMTLPSPVSISTCGCQP